ncbi:MAG: FapA family protein [Carnobacterium sp.]|uniref:DUF342 domain-containing protein n=1 Tax=Carnobacterium sp. TaxID=48221 RepID=UPI003316070D
MEGEIVRGKVEKLIDYKSFASYKNQLLKGNIWITKGIIYVKDDPGVFPTLQIDSAFLNEIIVTKNGKIMTEAMLAVSEKDDISIEVINEKVLPKCIVTTNEQQLKAFIEVEPGYEITRKIKNALLARRVTITLEEKKTVTEKVSIEEIRQALREANIFYGIREEVIIMASQAEEPVIYEVATGIPPQDGKDGFLEMKVDSKIKSLLREDERGNIDFRESREIPIVEIGEILGIIQPPQQGNTGISVTNKPIKPKPLNSITFYSENGTKLHGNRIVATRSGRPSIYEKDHIVKATVIPKFVQKGNVNLTTGNIHFFGDVEIKGEVEENMFVDAGSNVIVHSTISNSTVTAINSITSGGNIANSILSVGEKDTVIVQLDSYLRTITGQLEEMYEILSQTAQSVSYKNSEPKKSLKSIFKFLLQHRFNKFTDAAKNYIELVYQEKDVLKKEWQITAEQLKNLLFEVSQLDITLTQIQLLISMMHTIQDMNLLDFEESKIIYIASVSNSTLLCNGDIHVFGKGCLNSTIEAQGKVMICGYLRGGKITSKEGIKANIVGSTGGVKTILSVPAGSTIQIEKAYGGTTLHIGYKQLTLMDMQENITAYLNVNGNLVLK